MGSLRRVHFIYGILNCRRGINCRRRQFMPEILFVMNITGDNICCKKKSPAYTNVLSPLLFIFIYIFYLSIYCFLYLVNGSKGVLCYSYLYANLCFKYKNKIIIEWRFISIILVPTVLHIIYVFQIWANLNYLSVNCYFKMYNSFYYD